MDPDVQWSHDGRVVSSGSGTAYLSFSDIKRSDEGIYTCRANNTAGITEKQVNVTVNCKFLYCIITICCCFFLQRYYSEYDKHLRIVSQTLFMYFVYLLIYLFIYYY